MMKDGFKKILLSLKKFFCHKVTKIVILSILAVSLLIGGATFSINAYVKSSVDERIISEEEAYKIEDADCIIVLGCGLRDDGYPSDMLRNRLEFAVRIYKAGGAPKILMSGDHGREGYDEVNAMKRFAIDQGVPSEDIFMDHAGFSTYETMYRASAIFEARKVIVVTQEYHLYRSLYNATQNGIEAYGVASDVYGYENKFYRETREIIARCKDFIWCAFNVEPTFLGESIPVSGNGDITNDQ